jgi:two-component system, OmpR family, sensor kinase
MKQGLRYSLKIRMIIFGLLIHGAIWMLASTASAYTAVSVIFESLDQRLHEQGQYIRLSSRLFIHLLERFEFKGEINPSKQTMEFSESIKWENLNLVVWSPNGDLIYRSKSAPGFDFPATNGFIDEDILLNGRNSHWRIYNENIDGLFWISVGVDTQEARQRALDFGLKALYPMILIIPMTIFGVYFGVSRSMRPIIKLTREVSSRSPASLEAITEESIPEEMQPLVSSLNTLLYRLDDALENEHRFTANAAHELQTPLAAIKTELQLCQRSSDNPEVKEVLERIGSRVDRAVYTVRQLLTLARLESDNAALLFERLDLRELVAEDLADLAHLAVDRNLQIEFQDNEAWPIEGQRETLSVLVRNLLLNAFRYTTEGGRVEVSAKITQDQVKFYVANDSRSITAQERQQLVDRFYRIPGNETPGAGLGLSIVQRISSVHQAQLSIDAWHGDDGLMFTISFPRAS